MLNFGICQLFTLVTSQSETENQVNGRDAEKDLKMLHKVTDFLSELLSSRQLHDYMKQAASFGIDLLSQSLDICDQLIDTGDAGN